MAPRITVPDAGHCYVIQEDAGEKVVEHTVPWLAAQTVYGICSSALRQSQVEKINVSDTFSLLPSHLQSRGTACASGNYYPLVYIGIEIEPVRPPHRPMTKILARIHRSGWGVSLIQWLLTPRRRWGTAHQASSRVLGRVE
jgi:hypothetical protein